MDNCQQIQTYLKLNKSQFQFLKQSCIAKSMVNMLQNMNYLISLQQFARTEGISQLKQSQIIGIGLVFMLATQIKLYGVSKLNCIQNIFDVLIENSLTQFQKKIETLNKENGFLYDQKLQASLKQDVLKLQEKIFYMLNQQKNIQGFLKLYNINSESGSFCHQIEEITSLYNLMSKIVKKVDDMINFNKIQDNQQNFFEIEEQFAYQIQYAQTQCTSFMQTSSNTSQNSYLNNQTLLLDRRNSIMSQYNERSKQIQNKLIEQENQMKDIEWFQLSSLVKLQNFYDQLKPIQLKDLTFMKFEQGMYNLQENMFWM